MLFRRLINQGNTVILIEHRLKLIAQADWVIDMDPGGGIHGGQIVCEGRPQDVLNCPASKTGNYLVKRLSK